LSEDIGYEDGALFVAEAQNLDYVRNGSSSYSLDEALEPNSPEHQHHPLTHNNEGENWVYYESQTDAPKVLLNGTHPNGNHHKETLAPSTPLLASLISATNAVTMSSIPGKEEKDGSDAIPATPALPQEQELEEQEVSIEPEQDPGIISTVVIDYWDKHEVEREADAIALARNIPLPPDRRQQEIMLSPDQKFSEYVVMPVLRIFDKTDCDINWDGGAYVTKNMSKLLKKHFPGVSTREVIVIDNDPHTYRLNQERAIPISTYWGSDQDDELKDIMAFLKEEYLPSGNRTEIINLRFWKAKECTDVC